MYLKAVKLLHVRISGRQRRVSEEQICHGAFRNVEVLVGV